MMWGMGNTMKTSLYLLRQNLKFYHRRYFLFVLSVIFAVFVIISIGCFKDTFHWFQQERLYYEFGTYDLTTQQTVDTLSNNELVNASVQVSIEKLENQTQIIYVTAFNDLLPLHLKAGAYPKTDNEIAISYHDYRVSGEVELGQQITVGDKSYKVTGIIDDGRTNPYGYDHSFYKLGQVEGVFYNYLKLNAYSLNEIADIQKELETMTSERIQINTPILYNVQGLNTNRSLFDLSILCILAAIILTMFFWIKNMYLLSFSELKKNYQIYHSLGMNQKQLKKLVLSEAVVLGSIGSVLGIVVSIFILSIIFMVSGRSLFGYMAEIITVYPVIKISLLLLAFVAVMVPILWTAYHFIHIRDDKKIVQKYKHYDNKVGAVKMLSGIYYHNEKMKTLGIQLSICVSLTILCVAQFSLTSMITHQYNKMDEMSAIQLQVYTLADESVIPYDNFIQTIEKLMSLGLDKGSYEISAGNQFLVVFDKNKVVEMQSYDNKTMAALNADRLALNEAILLVKNEEEVKKLLQNESLAITYDDPKAEIFSLKIKDIVSEDTDSDNLKLVVSPQTIKAVNNMLATTGNLNMPKNVFMKFDSDDSYQLEKVLTESLESAGFDYLLLNKIKSLEEDQIQVNAISYFSYLIIGAILITSLISFISTLMLQIENRKNDYRIYQALGMKSSQLKSMLGNEIIRSLLPSYFMAVLVSFVLNYSITKFIFKGVTLWESYPYFLVIGMGIVLVFVSWFIVAYAKKEITYKNHA